jgi:hypothetical protein
MKSKSVHSFFGVAMAALAALVFVGLTATRAKAAGSRTSFSFDLVRSPALNKFPKCVPNARGSATVSADAKCHLNADEECQLNAEAGCPS